MAATQLTRLTRSELVAACRALQIQRDNAVGRATYWRERHIEASQRLAEHICDDRCGVGDHHDCPPAICEWNGCDCPCHGEEVI